MLLWRTYGREEADKAGCLTPLDSSRQTLRPHPSHHVAGILHATTVIYLHAVELPSLGNVLPSLQVDRTAPAAAVNRLGSLGYE